MLQQALEVVLASAGNARWSPSATQLAMAQHPPQDPVVSSLACSRGPQTHALNHMCIALLEASKHQHDLSRFGNSHHSILLEAILHRCSRQSMLHDQHHAACSMQLRRTFDLLVPHYFQGAGLLAAAQQLYL